jgi:hypothetical protein
MLFVWVNTADEWKHQPGIRFAEMMYVKTRNVTQPDPFQLRILSPTEEHMIKYTYDGDYSKLTAKKLS